MLFTDLKDLIIGILSGVIYSILVIVGIGVAVAVVITGYRLGLWFSGLPVH